MTANIRRALAAPALLSAFLALGACSGPDASTLVASAKDYLSRNDTKAAIIQLRNALQQSPANAEVRYLLGRAFLESGDPVGAELELRKALDLKHPADQVLPLLAQALVAQGEYRKVTTEFADPAISDPKTRADLQTTIAIAAMAQGDIKQARTMLDAALASDPKFPRANVARAKLALRGGDIAAANAALDTALAAAPNDSDAVVMKAELLAAERKPGEAIRLLEQAAAANPHAADVRFTLVELLVGVREIDKAQAIADEMSKQAPGQFRSIYANALILMAKGDAARAREEVQKLLASRAGSNHLPTLYLSALADYQLKNYATAEDTLRKVLASAPNHLPSRRVLAAVNVRSGRASQALEAVEAGLRIAPDDPMLLRLGAEARLLTGNVSEAAKLYERADALDRDAGAAGKVRLAQIRLASGDATRGLAELEKLSADDPTKIQADLALYAAHLRRREYDKALAAVASIEKKQPNSALAAELRGNVYTARRDLKEARKHFTRALELEPNRVSSARTLGLIDLQDGKVADAKARYERIAKAEPRNEAPLIALAEILALSGAPASEVKSTLDRAVAADANSAAPRIALVAHHRRQNDMRAALEAARTGANALPNDPRMVELLGVSQLAAGEAAQARETFSRLTQLLPQSPAAWIRVSEAYLNLKDYDAAIEAQRRAIAIQPDYAPALIALATTQLVAGRPDAAIADARKIQRDNPKQGIGYALEAEVLAAQKKYTEALVPLREALSRRPTAALASRNYAILNLAGRGSEANAFADKWSKEHPKDAAFLTQVGQQRQAAKDIAGATRAYRDALEIEPDNVIVLNNLAWLLNEQRKPEARDLAERAYALAPLNSNVVDTLGTIAMTQGDSARAVSLMRQATSLSPRDSRLRINLARALAKTGDKAAARRELEQVVAADARAPVKAEAQQLLREL